MKRFAGVASVGIAVCVSAGVASADYRQADPTLTISPTTVVAGGSITATVRSDCVEGSSIDFAIEPAGDATVAFCAVGRYVGRLTAPQRPGAYEVVAAGVDLDLEVPLTVTAPLGVSEPPLPSTGSDGTLPAALIGGVLVVGGGALVGLGRVRHRRVD